MSEILVTGAAGFIGMNTTEKLLQQGEKVVGIDNVNNYYDVKLKEKRLHLLKKYDNFKFYKVDIEDIEKLEEVFKKHSFNVVVNLAARAGVRYSIENPHVYLTTNTHGNLNLLELSKKYRISKFVLASTSSLYAGEKLPFSENLHVNRPISPYAASKKGAEAMCYTYHYLFDMDISILRFFTVYGPLGRPDMSIFIFFKLISEDKKIEIYGDGHQKRDFTYVDDIARGIIASFKPVGFEVINLGGHKSTELLYVVSLIEDNLGKKANIVYKEFHKADMLATCADIEKAGKLLSWKPKISIEEGITKTGKWWAENESWLKDIKI